MQTQVILTINANDQTGLVEKVANAIHAAGGNWMESSLSQLAGKFTGIVLVTVSDSELPTLEQALASLAAHNIHVQIHENSGSSHHQGNDLILLKVVANDRTGIIQEITRLLSSLNINVDSLDTNHISAPMSSESLFEASALISLPEGVSEEQLESALESLSDDLMVEMETVSACLPEELSA